MPPYKSKGCLGYCDTCDEVRIVNAVKDGLDPATAVRVIRKLGSSSSTMSRRESRFSTSDAGIRAYEFSS
jgi:hypothetical protein